MKINKQLEISLKELISFSLLMFTSRSKYQTHALYPSGQIFFLNIHISRFRYRRQPIQQIHCFLPCLPIVPYASPSLPVPAHEPVRLPITPCACPWSRTPPHLSLCLPMCPCASQSLPVPAHVPVRLPIPICACPCARAPPHHSLRLPMVLCASPSLPAPTQRFLINNKHAFFKAVKIWNDYFSYCSSGI